MASGKHEFARHVNLQRYVHQARGSHGGDLQSQLIVIKPHRDSSYSSVSLLRSMLHALCLCAQDGPHTCNSPCWSSGGLVPGVPLAPHSMSLTP